MCTLFSGHVVNEKGKNWGKVIVITGIHHEEDREKIKETQIIAWETKEKADVNSGVNFVHNCGQNIPLLELRKLQNIVEEKIKKLGNNYFIKKIAESNNRVSLTGTDISELPDNLVIEGDLYLQYTKITKLPKGLTVGGNLILHHTNITGLPNDLRVGESLDLENTNISELPDNLEVDGFLDLQYTKITKLPKNLTVHGFLNIERTNITELPDDLIVDEEIYQDNN